jgi:hypothetical protein
MWLRWRRRQCQIRPLRRRVCGRLRSQSQDDAGSLPGHVPAGCGRGQKVGAHGVRHRHHKVLDAHVDEHPALGVAKSNEIKGDVDVPCPFHHRGRVALHGLCIESIDYGRLGFATGSPYLVCHNLQCRKGPPGEEDRGSFCRKGSGDCAAYCSPAPINYRRLVLQHHQLSPSGS